jgi:DNA-binding PadR family transcriptional regulator
MSLEYAILGFLQYGPLSGYDLKNVFDMSVRHFWPADQSQIYRALAKLAERRWTEIEVIEQDDRPDRKVYHITDDGRKELHTWLSTPLPASNERIPRLIQIFFAGQTDNAEIMALIQHLADICHEKLAKLQQIPEQLKSCKLATADLSRDAFFWMLTRDYGIHMTKANLEWLENVMDRLQRGDHEKGSDHEDSRREWEPARSPREH